MMYKNKLVACVKANGKVLRESGPDKDTVFLPFGSEYSILLKNLNTVRALCTIEIDGQDVLDGEKLVVNANSEVDLQRFIKNGNQEQGNRFKFIERTAAIENGPRGVGAIDGIVRVSFQFEKRKKINADDLVKHVIEHHYHHDYWGPRYFARYPSYGHSMLLGEAQTFSAKSTTAESANIGMSSLLRSVNTASVASVTAQNATTSMLSNATLDSMQLSAAATPVNDVGITVAGSVSDQKFHTVAEFDVEAETEVIVLNLRGEVANTKVAKPITIQTKLKCSTCGTVNKSNAKFCRECGTALQIV